MSVRSWIAHLAAAIANIDPRTRRLQHELNHCKVMIASLLNKQRADGDIQTLADAEYRVFSQFGDDGIIQYLVRAAEVSDTTFVEFGVGDYTEANTRLLLVKDGWRGMICDAAELALKRVSWDPISWQYDLTVVPAFVTRDNINAIVTDHGFSGEIGLLSIDLDGNDYHVWEALTAVRPTIVVAEYNAVFGRERAVSVPYDERFARFSAHHSGLYWGASLPALQHVAERKGYSLIGCNSAGNNAYFVRNDRLRRLTPMSAQDAFRPARFRDSRDRSGKLSRLDAAAAQALIADLDVVNVVTGARGPLRTSLQ